VIDELGYLALPAAAAAALFQVVSQRYLKTSIVITSNHGVGAWGEILGDNTVAAALRDGQRKPASWRLVRKPTDTGWGLSMSNPGEFR
jgi:DNA replication protein DnaC